MIAEKCRPRICRVLCSDLIFQRFSHCARGVVRCSTGVCARDRADSGHRTDGVRVHAHQGGYMFVRAQIAPKCARFRPYSFGETGCGSKNDPRTLVRGRFQARKTGAAGFPKEAHDARRCLAVRSGRNRSGAGIHGIRGNHAPGQRQARPYQPMPSSVQPALRRLSISPRLEE